MHYTLDELKQLVNECRLPGTTPIILEKLTLCEDGGELVESMAMFAFSDNDGQFISLIGRENNLSKELDQLIHDF